MLVTPSKCLFKWINRIISKSVHMISKIIFILGLYKFLACLECISRNGLSFGHSYWHPSSVIDVPFLHSMLCKNWGKKTRKNLLKQDSSRIESTPSFPVWLPRALPPIELLRSIKHCSRPGFSMTSLMEHTDAQIIEHRKNILM